MSSASSIDYSLLCVGIVTGWVLRAIVAMYGYPLITHTEQQISFTVLWYLGRFDQWRKRKIAQFASVTRQKNSNDEDQAQHPIFINNYFRLLPATVTFHQSNGASLRGECAFSALQDILNDISKDMNGFVCCDYEVEDGMTTYRMALTNQTVYNGQQDAWPFGKYAVNETTTVENDGDIRMSDVQHLIARPGIIRAAVSSPRNETAFDVTAYFVTLEGPKNTFSDMTGISIDKLLLDSPFPNDLIQGSIISLQNVRGTITIPTETMINEAHQRLCVVGNE